jgi:hypothetical protein
MPYPRASTVWRATIVLLSDYNPDVIERAVADQLSPSALHAAGARDNPTTGR